MKKRIAKKIIRRLPSHGYSERQIRSAVLTLSGPMGALVFDSAAQIKRAAAKNIDRRFRNNFISTVESADALKALCKTVGYTVDELDGFKLVQYDVV